MESRYTLPLTSLLCMMYYCNEMKRDPLLYLLLTNFSFMSTFKYNMKIAATIKIYTRFDYPWLHEHILKSPGSVLSILNMDYPR